MLARCIELGRPETTHAHKALTNIVQLKYTLIQLCS